MSTVTCHTEGCPSSGNPIELPTTYTDEETGETRDVDLVVCGACGQTIDDVVQ